MCTTLTPHCHQTKLFSIWPLITALSLLVPLFPQERPIKLSPLMLGRGPIWAFTLCAFLKVVIKQIDRSSHFHNLTRRYPPWPPDKRHLWLSHLMLGRGTHLGVYIMCTTLSRHRHQTNWRILSLFGHGQFSRVCTISLQTLVHYVLYTMYYWDLSCGF